MSAMRRNPKSGGFTLLESMVSLAVVSVMMAAAAATVGAAARSRTAQQEMIRGQILARQLLSEIVPLKYEQPSATTTVLGPESGETRATFNDIDDFAGWSESPPADSSGKAISGYTGWTRLADVKWADATTLQTAVAQSETGVKRITVTVTAPSGRSWSVSAVRTKYGIYDKSGTGTVTYPGTANVSIQVGSNSATAASTRINLVNQVP